MHREGRADPPLFLRARLDRAGEMLNYLLLVNEWCDRGGWGQKVTKFLTPCYLSPLGSSDV